MWRLLRTAAVFVQQALLRLAKRRRTQKPRIRIVCLSDTHSQTLAIPDGDILIHAGDLSRSGHADEIQQAISWLSSQPHRYKIVIAGNADLCLDGGATGMSRTDDAMRIDGGLDWGDVRYLERSTTTLAFEDHGARRILTIYGDPSVPRCGPDGQEAFQYDTDQDYWRDSIPPGTDVLITHTPPKHILDEWDGASEGCASLLREVQRTRPLLHVFGHIHPAAGIRRVIWDHTLADSLPMLSSALTEGKNLSVQAETHGWVALMRFLVGSAYQVACSWLVGGVESGIFVNAACMSPDGMHLKNPPHVVYI